MPRYSMVLEMESDRYSIACQKEITFFFAYKTVIYAEEVDEKRTKGRYGGNERSVTLMIYVLK